MTNKALPFLLVHGGWLWMAVVTGAMAGALCVLVLVGGCLAEEADSERSGGPDVVSGVLRGAEGEAAATPLATTLDAEPDDVARAAAHLRAAAPSVVACARIRASCSRCWRCSAQTLRPLGEPRHRGADARAATCMPHRRAGAQVLEPQAKLGGSRRRRRARHGA